MDELRSEGFRDRPLWLVGVAGLLLAQAGFVLGLFDAGRAWSAVVDDRPVLSGRHPLHQYHGMLGGAGFCHHRATTCYDPAFQAGYPKTPVFDGGCRPAELFAALSGGDFDPASYKLGLFLCLLLVPLAFVLAGRGAGLPAGASVLAGAGGILLCWTAPVRGFIEEGELDFLMAGLGAIVFVAWLARYAHWCTADACLVLALTAAAGWYAHPIVWFGLFPIVVCYYLVFAPRHGPAWHLGLLGISVAGLAPNLWWLNDWVRYWWLRQPSSLDHVPLPAWYDVLGTPTDYTVLFGCVPCGGLVLLAGLAGLVMMWRAGKREAAGILFGAIIFSTALVRLLASWPRIPAGGAERLVPLGAGLLVLPAALGCWSLIARFRAAAVSTGFVVLLLLVVGWADGPERPLARAAKLHVAPLRVGFSPEHERILELLRNRTSPTGRILWDETTSQQSGWNWSALLPVFTNRSYLGGLDPESGIEHAFCGMKNSTLNGRPLAEWTDAELTRFCWWYNVGWVVARSQPVAERWSRYPLARMVAQLHGDDGEVILFELTRTPTFILSGSANWEQAGPNLVMLSEVVPDESGCVTLSLHDVPGLRVYPSYIRLLPVQDIPGGDPINHVKLLMNGPVPRVTLMWEGP